MNTQITRAKYEAPKLEVQRLRDLPSALANSGGRGCHVTGSKHGMSCSTSHK
ncbi:MAG: hypothetical protein ACRDIV_02155 [Ktedonobacteraceae bacterium]